MRTNPYKYPVDDVSTSAECGFVRNYNYKELITAPSCRVLQSQPLLRRVGCLVCRRQR